MEIVSKFKINNPKDIRHQVHITDIPLSTFKKRRHKYFLKVKKKYTYQTALVKIVLDSSIIQSGKNQGISGFNIRFTGDKINIYIDEQKADKKFIKKLGRYRITYTPIDDDKISVKVKSSFKKVFYENVIISRIEKVKNREESAKARKKNKEINILEDLRKRDLHYADMHPYQHSPNSDGNRSRREVFGGAFSGISRSGGKRK